MVERIEVHNHGTEEGKGLACRERRIGKFLIGECQDISNVVDMEQWVERKAISPTKKEIYKRVEEIDTEIMLLQSERARLESLL